MKRRERGLSTIVIILERRFSVQSSHDAATRVDSGSHHNEKTLLWLNYVLFNFNSYECNFMGRVVVVVHLNNNYTNFAITLDRPAHVHATYLFDSGSQTAHTQSHSLSPSNTPFLRNRPHHTAISPFDVDAEVARKTFSFSKGSFSRWDERGEREWEKERFVGRLIH